MFLNYPETTETLRTQMFPKKLSDCLNSAFKCPIDALCFTSTHCKGTRLRRVVTVYQKVDMVRCCVMACRWINNWTSSVMLLTRLLFAMTRYTSCIITETALPKTVIDVGTKKVRKALVSEFFYPIRRHQTCSARLQSFRR